MSISEISDEWLSQSLDALDLMRDSPQAGRKLVHILRLNPNFHTSENLPQAAKLIIAFADYFEEHYDAALSAFDELAQDFTRRAVPAGVAMALFGKVAIWRHRGEIRQAYELGHSEIIPCLAGETSRVSVLVYNTMAILAQELGYTEEAIRHFYTALNDAKALQNNNRVAQIMANLGEIFYVSGNAEDAEVLLEEATLLAHNSNERWLAPFISTMLALCKVSLDKYEEAYLAIGAYIDEFRDARLVNHAHRAFCLSVAAYTLAMRGQVDEADSLSTKAMELLDQFEDRHLKPYSWWVSGHLHRRHKRYNEAISDLRHAVNEVGGNGYIYMPLRAIKELSEIFAELGNWQEAFNEQKRYIELFEKAQGLASRVHVQTLHIRNELKEADLARRMAERSVQERRYLEEELKRMLAERETILENSIVGMVFLNMKGRVQWANTPLCQMFGVSRNEILGASLEPYYLSRDDYLRSGALVNEAVMRGESYQTELQMRRSDGSEFWVQFSGRAVDKNDLAHGTVWVVMDISARRQLEADLNKSEQHYRQLINNVTEGIVVVQDGKIAFANPRVQTLTGISAQQLHQSPFIEAIYPEDRPIVIDHHVRRLRGEQVEQYYQFRVCNRTTGELIWVELSAVMIEWEGKPATLSFVSDITQRKLLEIQLKESMAEQLRLQTLQMQNELREAEVARRHAEETTEAKSMFLANMSHEIRTPMNAIIGMTHLALRTQLDNKQRDYIEKIQNAGVSLLGIINDILDFSKIEAGKLDIEEVDFNLDSVVNNIATVTSAKADEKGLEYLFRIAPGVPRELRGDPLRLGQVLINLINNAIKFTAKGEIRVVCECLEVHEEQIKLNFVVSDTGIGMSREQSEKLFRPFSQADESTTRKFGGTGLGLSISKGMVELMGGQISLESDLAWGTRVSFSAWFRRCRSVSNPLVIPVALNGMAVLVVDDNPHAADILSELLSVLPLSVDVAHSAQDALERIQDRACIEDQAQYAVVFADLRMPDMDGAELTSAIKRDYALREKPRVVLVGAQARESVSQRDDVELPDAYLTKPVNASSVYDALVDLFANSRLSAPERFAFSRYRYPGLKVLLVEDNQVNQQIAVELMETAGIEVDVADNGLIALQMLDARETDYFGLVFMDVQMPEMDGHTATRLIRQQSRFSDLPVIAMTAHAMVEEREHCFASGMNAHLAKPINPKELYQVIAEWRGDFAVESQDDMPTDDVVMNAESEITIPGIDVEEGLTRTLGNRSFYLDLLARFCDDQRHVVDKIKRALLTEDYLIAERLAHTLKGVTGLIGAKEIQRLAGSLELQLNQKLPRDQLVANLGACDLLMRQTISAIEAQLTKENSQKNAADTGDSTDLNREQLQALIQRCEKLLSDYDGEASDLLLESSEVLAKAFGTDVEKQISRAIRQFDYDEALLTLRQAARESGFVVELN